jgi:hypothetical protein
VTNKNGAESTPEAQLRSLIGKLDAKHQKLVRSIRAGMRKRFPTANELAYEYPGSIVIAYSPTDRGIEAPVSLAIRADRVELFFNHGPKLPDPKKLLSGSGKQTRLIRLETARQLSDPDVESFMAASLELTGVPMPSKGEGSLIFKSSKKAAAKKRPRTRK